MLRPVVAASLLTALAAASAARAQDLAALCEKVRRPPVGAWSQFRYEGGRNEGATIRMSIVGTERQEGTEYLWLEVAMHGFGAGREGAAASRTMISKLLIRGFGPAAGAPRMSVMKIGDAPAMEMPAGRSRAGAGGAPMLENCLNAKVVGWESVTVPAGTFRALHIINAAGRNDSWIDPDLPFALVKEASNDQGGRGQLVLVSRGTGARSASTERPRPYDPRLLMEMMTGERPRARQRP